MSGEVAGKLADGLKEALIAAHHATVDNHHEKADAARTDFMERTERELADLWREKGLPDFADPKYSDEVRRVFGSITDPSHQVDFFFTLLAVAGLALSGGSAAAAGYLQQLTNRALHDHGDAQPDVGTVAAADNRGLMTSSEAQNAARYSGYQAGAYELIRTLGETWPALGEIITLWQRSLVDESYVDLVLRRQGFSSANAALLKHLRVGPPGAGVLAQAVTQDQLTMDQFAALLPQVGIDPQYADLIFRTEGQAPGVQQLNELYRRHLIDETTWTQGILESPIKNKYVDVLKKLRYQIPPMRTVLVMLRHKQISRDKALEYLDKLGFFPDDALALVDSTVQQAVSTVKTLSATEIVDLYEVGHWTADQAKTALMSHGYDAQDADDKIFLADERKVWARRQSAANRIGTVYTGWKIDRTTATQQLDAVGIPAPQRDDLLSDWDAVRAARTAHLTRADIHKAVNAEKMTHVEGIARLRAMGYDQADADLIPFIDKWSG